MDHQHSHPPSQPPPRRPSRNAFREYFKAKKARQTKNGPTSGKTSSQVPIGAGSLESQIGITSPGKTMRSRKIIFKDEEEGDEYQNHSGPRGLEFKLVGSHNEQLLSKLSSMDQSYTETLVFNNDGVLHAEPPRLVRFSGRRCHGLNPSDTPSSQKFYGVQTKQIQRNRKKKVRFESPQLGLWKNVTTHSSSKALSSDDWDRIEREK